MEKLLVCFYFLYFYFNFKFSQISFEIIDFSFSLDGRLIVVATQSEKFSLHTLLLPYNTVGINEVNIYFYNNILILIFL